MPIRPLAVRELLDLPYALIQARMAVIGGFAAVALVVAETVILGVAVIVEAGIGHSAVWPAVWIGALVAAWLTRLFMRGVVTVAGVGVLWGAPLGWRATASRMRAMAGPCLGVGLLQSAIGFGILLLMIPAAIIFPFGLIAVGWLRAPWFVAMPVVFAENARTRMANSRSRQLIRTAGRRIGGVWLLTRLILLVLVLPVLSIPLYLSTYSGTEFWSLVALTSTTILIGAMFTEVVESATRVVCYLDCRCRREALDITVPADGDSGRVMVG